MPLHSRNMISLKQITDNYDKIRYNYHAGDYICYAFISAESANKSLLRLSLFDPRGIEKYHDFLLLAGRDKSMFYNNHTQWLDSTRCTKGGEAWYIQTGMLVMGQVMGKSREEAEAILESSGTGRPVGMYVIKEMENLKSGTRCIMNIANIPKIPRNGIGTS